MCVRVQMGADMSGIFGNLSLKNVYQFGTAPATTFFWQAYIHIHLLMKTGETLTAIKKGFSYFCGADSVSHNKRIVLKAILKIQLKEKHCQTSGFAY